MTSPAKPPLLFLFLLLLAVACTQNTSPITPPPIITARQWQTATCPFDLPEGVVLAEDVICGVVTVPEQHALPDGATIQLAVAIFPATSPNPAPDPFLMFTGGPGGNIFDLVPLLFGGDNEILARRDIVLMSERGTYGATPFLDCPELASVDEQFGASEAERHTLILEAYTTCRGRLVSEGVNLDAYNNIERAADVPYVMEVLGYDQYNLWGVSGGGLLTQLVARDYPDYVRSIATDSGAFPQAHMSEVLYPMFDTMSGSFRRLFADCAADVRCGREYPNLEQVFFKLVADLNANPVPLTIEHLTTGAAATVNLDGNLLIQTMGNLFAAVTYFPKAIYDTSQGNYEFMIGVLPQAFIGDTGRGTADGLYQSVFCAEVGSLTLADLSTANSYPEVVTALSPFVQLNLDVCALWAVEQIPSGEPIISDVPALLMEGAYDANKPPALGEQVAQNFSTSYFVLMGDKAHVTLGVCGIALITEFLETPTQAPDMSCVPSAPSFTPPAGVVWGIIRDNWGRVLLGVGLLVALIVGIIWFVRRRWQRRTLVFDSQHKN